jgi:hypothetical protein
VDQWSRAVYPAPALGAIRAEMLLIDKAVTGNGVIGMYIHIRELVLLVLILVLTGCASAPRTAAGSFQFLEPHHRLLVMPPYLQIGSVTAKVEFVPNVEWHEQAVANISQALQARWQDRSVPAQILETPVAQPNLQVLIDELLELSRPVSSAIFLHSYHEELPTKAKRLDWSMGEKAKALGELSGHDYALFIVGYSYFGTVGLTALSAGVTVLSCGATPICIIMAGAGPQRTYASLVDLKTGQIVWFNYRSEDFGDFRSFERTGITMERVLATLEVATP